MALTTYQLYRKPLIYGIRKTSVLNKVIGGELMAKKSIISVYYQYL